MSSEQRPLRTDVFLIILHWSLFAAVIASFLSGLRVTSDWGDPFVSSRLESILLQGDVTVVHLWSSLAIVLVSIAYAVFLARARLSWRVRLDAERLGRMAGPRRRQRWLVVNVLLYWAAFLLIAALGVTGGLMYAGTALLPYEGVATVHRVAAWGLVVYMAAHVAAQAALGGVRQLMKILTPRAAKATAAGAAVVAGLAAVGAVYALDAATMRTLTLARIDAAEAPVLDGRPDDAVWTKAAPVTIRTVRGDNRPDGEIPVTVRALHDGTTAWFLFEWPDATRSQKHLPMIKTEEGWKLLEDGFARADERSFYEDKFAVMLAPTPAVKGGGASHMGPQPRHDLPPAWNGRGLHMTEDGSYVDVWHLKTVRVGATGKLDDNHFGPPVEPKPTDWTGETRYTAGYQPDPKTGGGFSVAMRRIDGALVEPTRLPKDLETLKAMGTIDLNPEASDEGQWWLAEDQTVPFGKDVDMLFPVGTVVPSVVIQGPYTGDRGDVDGAAFWENGVWRLEASRRLDTGSKYDQPIAAGQYLSVAAFDHTQTRHSHHIHPVRLDLEK